MSIKNVLVLLGSFIGVIALLVGGVLLYDAMIAKPKKEPTQTARQLPPKNNSPIEPKTDQYMVHVKIWDDTEKNRLHDKAELWFRGKGSTWLKKDLEFGSAPFNLGRRKVGENCDGDEAIQLYPDGRAGIEITVPFKLTSDMNPEGSDRDAILIEIGDDTVTLTGLPIKAATGKAEIVFFR